MSFHEDDLVHTEIARAGHDKTQGPQPKKYTNTLNYEWKKPFSFRFSVCN